MQKFEKRQEYEDSTSGSLIPRAMFDSMSIPHYEGSELDQKIEDLTKTIEMLGMEVNILKDKVDELETKSGSMPVNFRIIEVKEATVEEAREKIFEYYKEHEGESIYPDDVADELGLDLKITMQAVKELMKEGSLKEEK
ncbi:MAG: hypothetical protein JW878_04220 [Methanomicrobia archaeon]|nr:hypothetical protein [Methanomicrobia archaeon]